MLNAYNLLPYSISTTNGISSSGATLLPSTLNDLVERMLEQCVRCQDFFRLEIADPGFGQLSRGIKYLCSGQSLIVPVMMLYSLL